MFSLFIVISVKQTNAFIASTSIHLHIPSDSPLSPRNPGFVCLSMTSILYIRWALARNTHLASAQIRIVAPSLYSPQYRQQSGFLQL